MDVLEFDYELPPELIAQSPLPERDASRLLVLERKTGKLYHEVFPALLDYLNPGDTLVLNNTQVIPARLYGKKRDTGGRVEVLLLHPLGEDRWEVLVKPGEKVREGHVLTFGEGELTATVESRTPAGGRVLRFQYEGVFLKVLNRLGEMPLPPYIKEKLPKEKRDRYQTVYAKELGSAAAPTAGLHFTEELLAKCEEKGILLAYLTLHVGVGTFRPVSVTQVEAHHMHEEYYELDEEAARLIVRARATGGRVVAVGTTSCRALEAVAQKYHGEVRADKGWTELFIYPGYRFQVVDALVTNFHLPRSTLMMLVSALAGREFIMAAYREAVKECYRFFSFGDAMLIL